MFYHGASLKVNQEFKRFVGRLVLSCGISGFGKWGKIWGKPYSELEPLCVFRHSLLFFENDASQLHSTKALQALSSFVLFNWRNLLCLISLHLIPCLDTMRFLLLYLAPFSAIIHHKRIRDQLNSLLYKRRIVNNPIIFGHIAEYCSLIWKAQHPTIW